MNKTPEDGGCRRETQIDIGQRSQSTYPLSREQSEVRRVAQPFAFLAKAGDVRSPQKMRRKIKQDQIRLEGTQS
jgi:hypothetical protein